MESKKKYICRLNIRKLYLIKIIQIKKRAKKKGSYIIAKVKQNENNF